MLCSNFKRDFWFLSCCLFPCPPPPPPLPIPHTLTGSCVHYSCEAIDCPEPLIRNADLSCSSPGRHFYNGDRCTISCHSGYVLQIHQDDDLIKSQVNTPLLSVRARAQTPEVQHALGKTQAMGVGDERGGGFSRLAVPAFILPPANGRGGEAKPLGRMTSSASR